MVGLEVCYSFFAVYSSSISEWSCAVTVARVLDAIYTILVFLLSLDQTLLSKNITIFTNVFDIRYSLFIVFFQKAILYIIPNLILAHSGWPLALVNIYFHSTLGVDLGDLIIITMEDRY